MLAHPCFQLVSNVLTAVSEEHQAFGVEPVPVILDLSNHHARLPRLLDCSYHTLDGLDRGSLGAALGLAGTIAGAAWGLHRHTYCTAPHCFRCLCGLPSLRSNIRMRFARRARSRFIRVMMKPLVKALSGRGLALRQKLYALIGSPSRQPKRRKVESAALQYARSFCTCQHQNVRADGHAQLAGLGHDGLVLLWGNADVDVFVFHKLYSF